MPSAPPILVTPEQAAFIEGRVSVAVASRSAGNVPSVARALGCRVAPDRASVTLCVVGSQAGSLLTDIRTCGAIAVMFSEPSSHRSLQLKGRGARVCPASEEDALMVARYRASMDSELALVGFNKVFSDAFFSFEAADLVTLSFSPYAAFDQTPGPRAGIRLERGR